MRMFSQLLAGVSMLAIAGAAQAGEPITLGDAQMDNVTAAGMFAYQADFNAVVTKQKDVQINIVKNVQTTVQLEDGLAEAEAFADAVGFAALAETLTAAQAIYRPDTNDFFVEAFSESTAAAEPTPVAGP